MLPYSLWILNYRQFWHFLWKNRNETRKSGSILRSFIRTCALTPPNFTRCFFFVNSVSYTIKKFQNHLVKRQQCELSDAISERIWPFIVNKYHYSLRFVRHYKKSVWDFEGCLFFLFDLKPRTSSLGTSSL